MEVIDFIKQNKSRFEQGNSERQWYVLNKEKVRTGYLWFKHFLGGWNYIPLDNQSAEKTLIEDVEKLKTFLL